MSDPNFNNNNGQSSSAAASSAADQNLNALINSVQSIRLRPKTKKEKLQNAVAKRRATLAAKQLSRASAEPAVNNANELSNLFQSFGISSRRHKTPYSFDLSSMNTDRARRSVTRKNYRETKASHRRTPEEKQRNNALKALAKAEREAKLATAKAQKEMMAAAKAQQRLNEWEEKSLASQFPRAAAAQRTMLAAQHAMNMNSTTSSAAAASANGMAMNEPSSSHPSVPSSLPHGITKTMIKRTLKAMRNRKNANTQRRMKQLRNQYDASLQRSQRESRALKRNFPQPFVFNNTFEQAHHALSSYPMVSGKTYKPKRHGH
jgi:hypothetical protein